MAEILIIEDDKGLNTGITLGLKDHGRSFTSCGSLAEARSAIKNRDFALVILDLNLPDGSGYDFLKEFRLHSQAPVLILTANDMEMDEVMGFELGADDFVAKPFSLAVLRARVSRLLNPRPGRSIQTGDRSGQTDSPVIWQDHSLYLDPVHLRFEKDGRELALSRTEQKLLYLLLANSGRTVPREQLLEKIWPDGTEYVEENALSVAVSRLRAKLEDTPSKPVHILTVYGTGYVWK